MPTRDLTKFPLRFQSTVPMPDDNTVTGQFNAPNLTPESNAGIHGLTQTPALHDAVSSSARGFARGGSGSITNMLTSSSHAFTGVMRTKLQVIETPRPKRKIHQPRSCGWRGDQGHPRHLEHSGKAYLPESGAGRGFSGPVMSFREEVQNPGHVCQAKHRARPRQRRGEPAGRQTDTRGERCRPLRLPPSTPGLVGLPVPEDRRKNGLPRCGSTPFRCQKVVP